jgi:hypothetical protein
MNTRRTIRYIRLKWLFDFDYHKFHDCMDDKIHSEICFKLFGKWYEFGWCHSS